MASLIIQEDSRTAPPPQEPPQLHAKLIQILSGILILAVLYTLYFAKFLLLPIAVALLLAALLQPLADQLQRLRLPAELSAGIVVLLLISVGSFGIYRLSYPAGEWFERGPRLIWQAEFKFSALKRAIEDARKATRRLEEATKLKEGGREPEVVVRGPTMTERFLSQTQAVVIMGFMTTVLLYFLLARGRVTLERWTASLADPVESERWRTIFQSIQREITKYLATITLINAGLGVTAAMIMWLLEMPNPILWGVVAGCLNFIPYVGGLMTTTILAMVSIIAFDTPARILLPPLLFLILTALEGNFITPMLAGRRLGLNPLLLVVALLFWGWMWGIAGMLLVVPIQASLKIIARHMPSMFSFREVLR